MRILCIFLVVCTLLGMVPATAMCAGEIPATLSDKPVIKWSHYSLEAEELDFGENYAVKEDEGASGGKTLVALISSDASTAARKPDVSMKVNVSKKGWYSLYLRTKSTNENTNSIYYGFDNKSYTAFWQLSYKVWQWERILVALEPGEHIIKIATRRKDMCLDKVVFTNHPNYTPGEKGAEIDAEADIFSESGNMFFYENFPLPAYVPTKGHPRVMVNAEDIPGIRANLEHPQNKAAYKTVLNYAAYKPSVCEMAPKGNALTNYNSAAKSYIEANAFLYLINKDREAGRKAVEGMLTFLRTLDNVGHTNTQQVSRNEGEAIFSVAAAYDWCHDLMTPEERREIIELTVYQLQGCEYSWPPSTMDHAFHNGHAVEVDFMKILLACAIAFYDEYKVFYNFVVGRMLNDFVPVKNFLWNNDVINVVGNGYGRESYEVYMILLFDKMGAKNIVTDRWKDQLYGHFYTMIPSGGTLRIGDGNNNAMGKRYVLGGPMMLAANFYKDPRMKWLAAEASSGEYVGNAVIFLLTNDVNVGYASYEDLPLGMYSGKLSGTVITRTGWEKDISSDDMVVMMRIPEKNYGSHGHYDSGQFQIYYKGMLAMKSGIYSSMGSQHYHMYYKQAISSNCMLIYNPDNDYRYKYNYVYLMGGQSAKDSAGYKWGSDLYNGSSDFGEIHGVDFGDDVRNPDFSYLKGDLTKAYGGNADLYTRTFAFVNFRDKTYPGALIVMDKVKANPAYKRTFLLHSVNEPVVSENTQTIARTDRGFNGRMINETLLPENIDVNKVGGPGKEYIVGEKNYVDSVTIDSGSWRLEISPKENTGTDYFLNVMQVSDNDDSIAPLKSELIDTNTHYGVKIKDKAVFLSKNEKRTAKSISFTVNGEEKEIQYVVDGLKEGTWLVKGKDGEVAKAEATEDGGVINFKAAPGSYTVSYWSENFTDKPLAFYELDIPYREKEDRIGVVINEAFTKIESPIIKEEDKVLIPFEEMMKKLGLGDFYEIKDNKVEIRFFENHLVLDYEKDFTEADGVKYIELDKIDDTLTITYSYNSISKVMTFKVNTILSVPGEFVNSDAPDRIKVKNIVTESVNPHLLMDNQVGTNYYYNKVGTWAMFEFENVEDLKDVSIYWGNASVRSYKFKCETSVDGVNWNVAFEGNTDGYIADFESVKMEPCKAKYVRVTGYGNNQNNMFSIFEIKFHK